MHFTCFQMKKIALAQLFGVQSKTLFGHAIASSQTDKIR